MPDIGQKIYYKKSAVLKDYIIISSLIILVNFVSLPSHYLSFLLHPPGIYIIYLISAFLVGYLIFVFPVLANSILGIPAVECSDKILITRGWIDRRYDIINGSIMRTEQNESGDKIMFWFDDGRKSTIQLRYIDGPRNVLSLLEQISR